MGTLTYTEMAAEVKVEVMGRDDIDTIISNAIFMAYQNIAATFRHYELETDVFMDQNASQAAQAYVTLSDSIRTILSVRDDASNIGLVKTDFRLLDDMRSFSIGIPSHYARFGRKLFFDKATADGNRIYIRHTQFVSRLSGTQKSLLSSDWDEGIVLGAIYRVLNRLKEYDQAEAAKGRYLEFVLSLTDPKVLEDEDLDEPLGLRRE